FRTLQRIRIIPDTTQVDTRVTESLSRGLLPRVLAVLERPVPSRRTAVGRPLALEHVLLRRGRRRQFDWRKWSGGNTRMPRARANKMTSTRLLNRILRMTLARCDSAVRGLMDRRRAMPALLWPSETS